MSLNCIHDDILKDKKMAHTEDWHSAKIVSELRIRTGKSLRQLSTENGLAKTTLSQALQRPYPNAELIIAKAIGVIPQDIWPSRYNSDGSSSRRKGKRSITKKCPTDTSLTVAEDSYE